MSLTVQSWYGEIESYGSATATRYGTGFVGNTSWAGAVRPPVDEEKYVMIGCPW